MMRIFYDKDENKISRNAVREKMVKESTSKGAGDSSDKKIKRRIIKGMCEEEFARLNGMSYKDFKNKK